jgi:DNA-binding Lrp family transcriptional regulator
MEFLSKTSNVHWVGRLEGNYDFCIVFLIKNLQQLDEACNSIIYRFDKHIADKEFSLATHQWYLPYNYLYEKNENKTSHVKPEKDFIALDKKDYQLISLIKENSRTPMLTLMEKMAMSPQAIREHIKNLIKKEIITGFNIRIDHTKFKLHHFHTFLYLSNIDGEKEKRIVNFLTAKKSTTHIIKGTGKWGLEFESVFPSYFELHDMLKELKDRFPENIAKYDSGLIYKIYPINTVVYE